MTPDWALAVSNTLIAISVIVGGIPAMIFPLYYHWKSAGGWRDSNVGRNTMAISAVLGGLYLSGIIRWFLPDEFLQFFVRPLLSVGCAIVVIWRFAIFVQLYRDKEREAEIVTAMQPAQPAEEEETYDTTGGISEEAYRNIEASSCAADANLHPATHAEGVNSDGSVDRSKYPPVG